MTQTPDQPSASSRRSFGLAQATAALAVAFLAVAWWMPLRSEPLTVTFTRGGALVESSDGSRAELVPGATVSEGDRIVLPEGASVSLDAPDGHEVTISDSARVEVSESRGTWLGGKATTRLEVESGGLRVTGEARPRTSLDIGLPNGVAGVRGTEFTARVGSGADFVSVHQGSVVVASPAGGSVSLAPGQGVVISPTGPAVRELPGAPVISLPDAGAEVVQEGTLLVWSPVPGASGYVVEVASDERFREILLVMRSDSASAVIPAMDEDMPAVFRVYAVTEDGLDGAPSTAHPLEIRIQRALGLALLGDLDVEGSLAALEAAVPNYGEDVDLLKGLGWAFFLSARYEESRDAYERARALAPQDVDLLLELGRVHFYLQDIDAGEETYRAVLAELPDDADALWGLAEIYRIAGRRAEAVVLAERALSIQPRHPYAGETLRLLREEG